MTDTVSASIEVTAPLSAVYNQWTQFEEFPRFMSAVQSVTQLDDRTTHWVVQIGGVTREFDAAIVEQVPDTHLSWASLTEKVHAGAVRFAQVDLETTRVTLEMMWEPETFTERVGAALGFDERAVKSDLEHFRDFIQQRGTETGGWRGEIHDAAVDPAGGPGAPGV